MNRWLLPLRLMVLFLSFLALLASLSWYHASDIGFFGIDIQSNFPSLFHLTLLLGGNFLASLIGAKWLAAPRSPWEHRVITALILFLLFDSLTPWWVFFLLGFLTKLLESSLRISGGPVFNPAALGALAVSTLGFLPTWWGTNFGSRLPLFEGGMSIIGIFTLLIAGFIAYRYKKLPLVASGFLFFILSYFLLFQSNPLPIAFEGTLLFFFLVMAAEPKTSPNIFRDQLFYGALIGLLIPLFLHIGFLEAYLGALLLGNLYHRRKALLQYFKKTESPLPITTA